MHIKISAIVPVYNNEFIIRECLDSLLFQSVPFYEIIVVDDGSSDKTLEIIKKIKGIKIIDLKKNKGRSFARNFGAKNAKGNYIAFIESDSIYNKEWVKEVTKTLLNNNNLAVDRRTTYNQDTLIGKMNAAVFDARFKDYSPINAWIFNKKIFLNSGGFSESLSYGEDVDLGTRLIRSNYKIAFVSKAVQRHYGEPATILHAYIRSKKFGSNMHKYYSKYPDKFPKMKFFYFTILPFLLIIFWPLFVITLIIGYLQIFTKYIGKLPAKFLFIYPVYGIFTEAVFVFWYWTGIIKKLIK